MGLNGGKSVLSEGVKYDQGKERYDLIDEYALNDRPRAKDEQAFN